MWANKNTCCLSFTYTSKHFNVLKHFPHKISLMESVCVVCLQYSVNVCKTVRNSSMTLVSDFMSVTKETSGSEKPVPSILLLFCSTVSEKPKASIPLCYSFSDFSSGLNFTCDLRGIWAYCVYLCVPFEIS